MDPFSMMDLAIGLLFGLAGALIGQVISLLIIAHLNGRKS